MVEAKEKTYQNKYIFEYLRNVIHDKSKETLKRHLDDKDSMKSFPFVVIMRYLSMCEDERIRNYIVKNQLLLERLDKIGNHDIVYKTLFNNLPKTGYTFIKYLK